MMRAQWGLVAGLALCVAAARAQGVEPGITPVAGDGYGLWLQCRPAADAAQRAELHRIFSVIRVEGDSATCAIVRRELQDGLGGLLGARVASAPAGDGAPGLLAGTLGASAALRGLSWADRIEALGEEGFAIRAQGAGGDVPRVILAANTDIGLLYGAFHLLRVLQTNPAWENLEVYARPRIRHRLLNHWDNLDGSIERGYAGRSLWDWEALPDRVDPRITDYARANASIGINGAAINNVNANPIFLSEAYLPKVAAIADTLRPYGIRVYLSVNFASPIREGFSLERRRRGGIGDLDHADPLDPAVRAWWRARTDAIYRLIPDFGGFLVKANSEGMPGPQDYGRTHVDGANMLAEALAPHGGIVMWRAFVYSPDAGTDRAKQAYDEFVPFDGQFAGNVFVQAKNGPIDFQPREPVQPLFAAMPRTRLMLELQITQEYLGHANHLVYLAPMWKEYLDTDLTGEGGTLASIIDGSQSGRAMSGIAGVANTGSDRNWCGHLFGQANWYAYGRLSWDHTLSPAGIADEWIRLTFGADPVVRETVRSMMLSSWEACVNYMTPLGLHHIMQEGVHYGPQPDHARGRPDWTSVYYHRADHEGLGFDRSPTGSNAAAQYPPALQARYADRASCPDKFLLWFHHVPWDYRLQSTDRTLWEELQARYTQGVESVDRMRADWQRLEDRLDPQLFAHVDAKLAIQQRDARHWRDTCLEYFGRFRSGSAERAFNPPEDTP